MPSLPDWFYLPRLQEVADWLSVPVNDLQASLKNQGVWANPDTRVIPDRIFAALQAEIDAGRPFRPVPLEKAKA